MDSKKLISALLLAVLGLALAVWNLCIMISNSNAVSLLNFKSQIVLIITGILLVIFAIFYAKNEDRQYKEEDEDGFEDGFEIIYDENGGN